MTLMQCRICLEEEVEGQGLVAPCKCIGTMKYVHFKCLKEWRRTCHNPLNVSQCDICGQCYHLGGSNKVTEDFYVKFLGIERKVSLTNNTICGIKAFVSTLREASIGGGVCSLFGAFWGMAMAKSTDITNQKVLKEGLLGLGISCFISSLFLFDFIVDAHFESQLRRQRRNEWLYIHHYSLAIDYLQWLFDSQKQQIMDNTTRTTTTSTTILQDIPPVDQISMQVTIIEKKTKQKKKEEDHTFAYLCGASLGLAILSVSSIYWFKLRYSLLKQRLLADSEIDDDHDEAS